MCVHKALPSAQWEVTGHVVTTPDGRCAGGGLVVVGLSPWDRGTASFPDDDAKGGGGRWGTLHVPGCLK